MNCVDGHQWTMYVQTSYSLATVCESYTCNVDTGGGTTAQQISLISIAFGDQKLNEVSGILFKLASCASSSRTVVLCIREVHCGFFPLKAMFILHFKPNNAQSLFFRSTSTMIYVLKCVQKGSLLVNSA